MRSVIQQVKINIAKIANEIIRRNIMTQTLFLFLFLTGCSSMPQFFSAVQEIETDDAIKISVSREALQKQTDLTVMVDVKNGAPSPSK